jgi:3-carboxy-cis,cis-muconate cycloisomerase
MFTTPAMQEAVSDESWLQAMLDAEAALARAEAQAGLIPPSAAVAIAAACTADRFDLDEIGGAGVAAGNPVVPLVEALRAAVAGEASNYVHHGATSQDILDTATMLIVRSALDLLDEDLHGVAAACAELADQHRATVMSGRTLLQQAVPITFGLKAAGWLTATLEARTRLAELRAARLAVQLGGAAGTLAAMGPAGLDVVRSFAEELGLAEPVLPWHTARARIAEIAAALAIAAGVMGKIALDVSLLMQTEVGEAFEPGAPGRGRSSAMPQKRNPVGAVAVAACARRAQGLAGVLLGTIVQEHERAAGAWQAEWESLSSLLEVTAGAVFRVREMLEGLEIDAERMRENLDTSGGFAMAERVVVALAEHMGQAAARARVQEICARALEQRLPLRDALLLDIAVRGHFSTAQVDALLDPANYLGATSALIDRALAAYRSRS